jgi:hypothetical protein
MLIERHQHTPGGKSVVPLDAVRIDVEPAYDPEKFVTGGIHAHATGDDAPHRAPEQASGLLGVYGDIQGRTPDDLTIREYIEQRLAQSNNDAIGGSFWHDRDHPVSRPPVQDCAKPMRWVAPSVIVVADSSCSMIATGVSSSRMGD